jgi:hypothetical protein
MSHREVTSQGTPAAPDTTTPRASFEPSGVKGVVHVDRNHLVVTDVADSDVGLTC